MKIFSEIVTFNFSAFVISLSSEQDMFYLLFDQSIFPVSVLVFALNLDKLIVPHLLPSYFEFRGVELSFSLVRKCNVWAAGSWTSKVS